MLLVEVSAGAKGDKAGKEDRKVRKRELPHLAPKAAGHKPGHTHTLPQACSGKLLTCVHGPLPAYLEQAVHQGATRRLGPLATWEKSQCTAARKGQGRLRPRHYVQSLEAEAALEMAQGGDQSPSTERLKDHGL